MSPASPPLLSRPIPRVYVGPKLERCPRPGLLLSVQRRLLLRRGKGPGRARAALLAKHKPQLLRRLQLCLMRAECRARLGQLERAQHVLLEEAFLACHFARRALALRGHAGIKAAHAQPRTGRSRKSQGKENASRKYPAASHFLVTKGSAISHFARFTHRSNDHHA